MDERDHAYQQRIEYNNRGGNRLAIEEYSRAIAIEPNNSLAFNNMVKRTPNLSVNTDAPCAALGARTEPPVTFVR